jgi:hypothetical protein
MLDTARNLIIRELAVAQGDTEDLIADEIDAIFREV